MRQYLYEIVTVIFIIEIHVHLSLKYSPTYRNKNKERGILFSKGVLYLIQENVLSSKHF
jgi:hypothetical protein